MHEAPPLSDALLARQAEMINNRVRKTWRHLSARMERQNIGAFRLYDRDIPEIRLVVDWVEGHLVVGEYTRWQTSGTPHLLATLAQAAASAVDVPPDRVHLKQRRTRPDDGERYGRLGEAGARLPVREHDLRFWVNLDDYIDIGLFPDHRRTRARVRAEAEGKAVLNLFGYTGAFTVAAAAGGASATTTVDANGNYLAWAVENLKLNGLMGEQHAVVRADVRTWLRAQTTQRWDVAVLDAPSYSDREGGLDIQRDQRPLVADALAVLRPGGVLYFATNHQAFEPELDDLAERWREITGETVPEDYRNRKIHRCFKLEV